MKSCSTPSRNSAIAWWLGTTPFDTRNCAVFASSAQLHTDVSLNPIGSVHPQAGLPGLPTTPANARECRGSPRDARRTTCTTRLPGRALVAELRGSPSPFAAARIAAIRVCRTSADQSWCWALACCTDVLAGRRAWPPNLDRGGAGLPPHVFGDAFASGVGARF